MRKIIKKSKKLMQVVLAALMVLMTVNVLTEKAEAATGSDIVSEARKYMGTPYVWGGTTTSGFDCSGYTQYVFRKCGVSIGRTTYDQIKNGSYISKSQLEAGDLVFFKNTYSGCQNPSHVGIYIGGNQFIHASSSKGVTISDFNSYYNEHYYGARRIVNVVPGPSPNPNSLEELIFDARFYSDNYPDLKKAFGYDENALRNHFKTYGIKEGRCASPIFSVAFYLHGSTDLMNAFGKDNYEAAYNHFLNFGYKEGRHLSEIFCIGYYADHNPDVKNAFGNDYVAIIRHFVTNGMKEGRQGSENFNLQVYKNKYEDLRNAFGENNAAYYRHYMTNGIKEGRTAK